MLQKQVENLPGQRNVNIMKVILSRKSLDAKYGGIPSPIIRGSDGKWNFYPIPIPRKNAKVSYKDLYLFDDVTISEFLSGKPLKPPKEETCHLDPDLCRQYLKPRSPGWKGAFGQSRAAQGHLENCRVGADALFLFFGWFKFAIKDNGKYKFYDESGYPNGFHAIYGYLEVEKLINPKERETVPKWLENHPHYSESDYYGQKKNVIYVAKEQFSHSTSGNTKRGYGIFSFHEELILTQKGQDKKSIWDLDPFFYPSNGIELSYHPLKKWKMEKNRAILFSAYPGQEFVVKVDPEGKVENWARNLVLKYGKREP